MLTDRGRQRIQSLLESMRVRGEQAAMDLRDAAFEIPDPDLPLGLALLVPPHRIRVGLTHDPVDLPGQPALGHRRPARHFDGQLYIHRRQHFAVGDQIGAIHDRLKRPINASRNLKIVTRYCQLQDVLAAALDQLARDGFMVEGSHKQLRCHPALVEIRAISNELRLIEVETGCTPEAAAKSVVAPELPRTELDEQLSQRRSAKDDDPRIALISAHRKRRTGRAPSGVDSALYGALRAVFAAFGGRSRSHARRLRRLARSLTGIGKTHLAIGLGVKAAHAGHSALFDTASNWITRLTGAHRGNRLEAELEKIRRYKLIIIDEVGYIPFDQDAAHLFFQLIASRYEQGSIMVTSNLPFGRWGQTFADDDVAAAMIDRLVHHAEVLTLTGDSYRTRAPRALRAKDRTAD